MFCFFFAYVCSAQLCRFWFMRPVQAAVRCLGAGECIGSVGDGVGAEGSLSGCGSGWCAREPRHRPPCACGAFGLRLHLGQLRRLTCPWGGRVGGTGGPPALHLGFWESRERPVNPLILQAGKRGPGGFSSLSKFKPTEIGHLERT